MQRVRNIPGGACGADEPLRAVLLDLSGFVRGEPVSDKSVNERVKVVERFLGHVLSMLTQDREHIIDRVLPVEELPEVDAGRVEAEASKSHSGIWVEEHGPIVEFLTEHNVGVS